MVVDIGGIVSGLIEWIVLSNLGGRWWQLLLMCGLIASGWVLDFFQ